MTENSINFEQSFVDVEQRRLESLSKKYEKDLGPIKIIPVGSAGYIIERKSNLPMAGNDWLMFDYDDTLAATSEIKQKRAELFTQYLTDKIGKPVLPELAKEIIETTDDFSRWEDQEAGGDQYHANVHMSALSYVVDTLINAPHKEESKPEDVLKESYSILSRIKGQLQSDDQSLMKDDDPFRIRFSDKKFVMKGSGLWRKGIENIFMQTMINPPHYKEAIESANKINPSKDSIHRLNIGMLSYGDPYYQLLKILELAKQNPGFSVSQIWLTRVGKGDFVKQAIETGATSKTTMEYVPKNLEEDAGESMSYGFGYPLGKHNHVIVHFDDSVKEGTSLMGINPYLKENTGAEYVVVRSLRPNTKEATKTSKILTPHGTVDFRNASFLPKDIAKIFQLNRYLARKSRFGEDDAVTKRLKQELTSNGVEIDKL